MDVPPANTSPDRKGHDLLNEPLYTVNDVARMLHVRPDTLRYWVCGKTVSLADGREQTYAPLVGDGSSLLSFQDLAELAVVAHLKHLGFILTSIRRAANHIQEATGRPRPFLNEILTGGGTEIALELERGKAVSMTHGGQTVLPLPRLLDRLQISQNLVVRVFPFSRPEEPDTDPQLIEINPYRRFGRPITRPNGLDVAAIWDRFRWGETTEELMEDLGAGRQEIEEAIRYQQRYVTAA